MNETSVYDHEQVNTKEYACCPLGAQVQEMFLIMSLLCSVTSGAHSRSASPIKDMGISALTGLNHVCRNKKKCRVSVCLLSGHITALSWGCYSQFFSETPLAWQRTGPLLVSWREQRSSSYPEAVLLQCRCLRLTLIINSINWCKAKRRKTSNEGKIKWHDRHFCPQLRSCCLGFTLNFPSFTPYHTQR